MPISAKELTVLLKGTLEGNGDAVVSMPAKIEEAEKDNVSFIANPKYEQFALQTKAGVLIVRKDFAAPKNSSTTFIKVDDPYMSFAKVLEVFSRSFLENKKGIEQPSHIAASAKLGDDIYVGAFSYIGDGAKIGSNVKIFPNVFVGDGVTIGNNTILYPGVKIYHACVIGNNCIIHAGAVIGSDGFGFAAEKDGAYNKVPQTGNVILEDNVEIGANTCIDRATMGSTILRKGVKLDNLVQVAHNVEIDENTAIAAQAGISGSAKLGKNIMAGGQAGFIGHIVVADGSRINAQSGVNKSITEKNKAWTGSPASEYFQNLKSQVIYRNLPLLEKKIRELEDRINDLKNNK